jgi:hypothetical protein
LKFQIDSLQSFPRRYIRGENFAQEGDALLLWGMDGDAKRQAIEGGKIKGVIEEREHHGSRVEFTDTTENVARFVAGAGDGLFSKDVLRLERVK